MYYSMKCQNIIRLIPQGTVDINLGTDRLEGPKALDTNCQNIIRLINTSGDG